jgi:hypothetical protein
VLFICVCVCVCVDVCACVHDISHSKVILVKRGRLGGLRCLCCPFEDKAWVVCIPFFNIYPSLSDGRHTPTAVPSPDQRVRWSRPQPWQPMLLRSWFRGLPAQGSHQCHCLYHGWDHRISIPAYAVEQQRWQSGVPKYEMSLMSSIWINSIYASDRLRSDGDGLTTCHVCSKTYS